MRAIRPTASSSGSNRIATTAGAPTYTSPSSTPGWCSPAGVGRALTVRLVTGVAINPAHELGHKRASVERWLSKVALAQSGYGHFFIEHNRGHHVRVATPEDPASSRLGESFWAFLPRTVSGSLRSSWELERVRLARGGSSPWTARNDILSAWAMSVVL